MIMGAAHTPTGSWIQRVGVLAGLILAACLMDGLAAVVRTPKTEIRLYPGMKTPVAGKTEAAIPERRWLTYETTAPGLSVTFLEAKGRLWRAELAVEPTAPEGTYTFRVFLHGEKPEDAAQNPLYTIRLLADRQAFQASERSFVLRYLGLSPWVGAAAAMPFLVFCLYLSYKASDRLDEALRRQGMAPVYRTVRKDKTTTLFFGLGSADGVSPGDSVTIVAEDGRPLGVARVETVSQNDAQARLDDADRLPPVVYVSRS
ncbi:MAG: hypothetical protein WHS86_15885 [Desulfosoma sp.]